MVHKTLVARITLATSCWMTTAGIVLAGSMGFINLQAQIPGVTEPEAAPTTILGALIAVTMSMAGGYWYIIKRLFETTDQIQKTFVTTVEKLIEDRKEDRTASAERHQQMMGSLMAIIRQNNKLRHAADEDTPNS